MSKSNPIFAPVGRINRDFTKMGFSPSGQRTFSGFLLVVFCVQVSATVVSTPRKFFQSTLAALALGQPDLGRCFAQDFAPAPLPTASVQGGGVDRKGLLRPCAGSCISSQDDRPKFFIPPLCYDGDADFMFKRLVDYVLRKIPDAKIVSSDGRYLHALLVDGGGQQFADEIEFYLTPGDNTIQFRLEHIGQRADFGGVNRKRIEDLVKGLGLDYVPVLRNRQQAWWSFGLDTPFDDFGPSLPYDQDVF